MTGYHDATAAAELVRRGEATPLELTEAAIARIEECDPAIGAVIVRQFDAARERAAGPLPDGPFRGVPMVMKDLGGAIAGDPYWCGTRFLHRAGYVAPRDDHVSERFLRAGFVVVGRTNTPEIGLEITTEPAAFGPTRNPWDPARSAGGSSGGSAAAVAAGMVPIGHANDGAGSIRIPAALCGLVGLKPTRGRVSLGPDTGDEWGGLSTEGFVARSVRDTARLLDVLSGPMAGDPHVAPPPERPFACEVLDRPAAPLRVGVLEHCPDGTPCHPEVARAVQRAAGLLDSLGHDVGRGHPAALGDDRLPAMVADVISAGIAATVDELAEAVGARPEGDDLEPTTWAIAERGRALSAVDLQRALAWYNDYSRRLAAWWEHYDVLVIPTFPRLAPELGTDAGRSLEAFLRATPFTPPANVSGQPSITLPLHQSAGGLPVGVQFMGGFGREDVLLRVAAQLERAASWVDGRPPVPEVVA